LVKVHPATQVVRRVKLALADLVQVQLNQQRLVQL
jgi:hypothetical protein